MKKQSNTWLVIKTVLSTLLVGAVLGQIYLHYLLNKQYLELEGYIKSGHVWMMDDTCAEQLTNGDFMQIRVIDMELDEDN